MRKNMTATIAALAGLAAGCHSDSVLSFLRVPETQFVLRTVQGNPLPTVAIINPGYTAWIIADTLTLRNDGTGTRSTLYRYQNVGAGAPGTPIWPLRYTLTGTKIEVTLGCPLGYYCIGSFSGSQLTGEVTRTGIRFDKSPDFLMPMVFEKRP